MTIAQIIKCEESLFCFAQKCCLICSCYWFTDIEAPTLTCVEDKSVHTDEGKPTALVVWEEPDASDNSGNVYVTCDPPSGTNFPIGQTTVTCNAVDESGNNITCYFQVYATGIKILSTHFIFVTRIFKPDITGVNGCVNTARVRGGA